MHPKPKPCMIFATAPAARKAPQCNMCHYVVVSNGELHYVAIMTNSYATSKFKLLLPNSKILDSQSVAKITNSYDFVGTACKFTLWCLTVRCQNKNSYD